MEGGEREKGIDVKGRCKEKEKNEDKAGISRRPSRVEVTVCLPGVAWHGTARHGRAVLGGHSSTCLGLFFLPPQQLSRFLGAQLGCCEVIVCMKTGPSETLDVKLDEDICFSVSVFDWHEGATSSILTSVSHQ